MKKIVVLLVFLCLLCISRKSAYASFGAGSTPGWPNASDGLVGKSVAPLYLAPPFFYTTTTPITLTFTLINPSGNTSFIDKPVYIRLLRISHSPKSLDLYYPQSSTINVISEQKLYENNQSDDDYQLPYKTIPLDTIFLQPGQETTITSAFTIGDPGYYQFDITDLDANTQYIPGHIYVAGFLRILPSQGSTQKSETALIDGVQANNTNQPTNTIHENTVPVTTLSLSNNKTVRAGKDVQAVTTESLKVPAMRTSKISNQTSDYSWLLLIGEILTFTLYSGILKGKRMPINRVGIVALATFLGFMLLNIVQRRMPIGVGINRYFGIVDSIIAISFFYFPPLLYKVLLLIKMKLSN